MFYDVELENTKSIEKIKTSLEKYDFRQQFYFKDKYSHFKEIDDLFLTMEGFGQYTMYVWLIHENGGNIDKNVAIKAVRREGKNWSQEHGFGLFLIIHKLTNSKEWVKCMIGNEIISIKNLISKELKL